MDKGMSPRKAMASEGGGSFGVKGYPGSSRAENPDKSAKIGEKGMMADHERGIGMPIRHSSDMHPAQAAPKHGPMHKSLEFNREDTV